MGTSPGSGRLFITYLCRQGLPGRLARGKYSSCHSRVHAPSSSLGTKRKGAWLHALWLRLAPILGCDWSTHLKEKKKKRRELVDVLHSRTREAKGCLHSRHELHQSAHRAARLPQQDPGADPGAGSGSVCGGRGGGLWLARVYASRDPLR